MTLYFISTYRMAVAGLSIGSMDHDNKVVAISIPK